MFDLIGDLTPQDATTDKLIFTKGDVVKFSIKDFRVNDQNGQVILDCIVENTEHVGKPHTIFIPVGDTIPRRKQRAAFFFNSGIWTEAEVKAQGGPKMSRLMGRKIQGVAGTAKAGSKDPSVTFQDIVDIKDIGPGDGAHTASNGTQPTTQAAAVAGQTSF